MQICQGFDAYQYLNIITYSDAWSYVLWLHLIPYGGMAMLAHMDIYKGKETKAVSCHKCLLEF